MQAPIAEAAMFLVETGIVRPGRLVPHGHAAAADGFTRPPFAHPMGIREMHDSLPLGHGRHHFFPRRSLKAPALSNMASAKSRFSRVFSSFRGRERRWLGTRNGSLSYFVLPEPKLGCQAAAAPF